LQPKRLEEVLSAVLHRRKERTERRTTHIAELRKRATEAEAKLKRFYEAIENGIADVSDPLLKERVTELKSVRDQARADAERAEGAFDRAGPSITPEALKTFASQARRRMRTESGGYRRDHLRALAQRIEVDAWKMDRQARARVCPMSTHVASGLNGISDWLERDSTEFQWPPTALRGQVADGRAHFRHFTVDRYRNLIEPRPDRKGSLRPGPSRAPLAAQGHASASKRAALAMMLWPLREPRRKAAKNRGFVQAPRPCSAPIWVGKLCHRCYGLPTSGERQCPLAILA
jgi:hypothetical protein